MSAAHVDDGELILLLDGECADDERERLARHLVTCPACAERRRTLVRLAGAVTATLRTGDAVHPRERNAQGRARASGHRTPALRAAVILVVVGAGVAAANTRPVQAWLAARWADLRGVVAPGTTSTPASPNPTTVRFVPLTPVFALELVAYQHAGALTIAVSHDTLATATVTPGVGGGEALVVLPTGLRIVNGADSRASYEVQLPRSVTEIWVRIGAAPARRLVPTTDVSRWTIDVNARKL